MKAEERPKNTITLKTEKRNLVAVLVAKEPAPLTIRIFVSWLF
jgi:hypothetical protein